MERWTPPVKLAPQEKMLMKRLTRVRKLFGFLREHRHELFDEEFQEQLEGMYRDTGAGDQPHPPALLCMVMLLQGYVGASDAEAVELSLVDLRWQMVLDCMGASTPPFSQGGLVAFRNRMIEHEMDRALLERTVALVRSGALSEGNGRAVSKALRVAIDSRPLAGAGRVEDTINLLGHSARCIVQIVSRLTKRSPESICRKAGIPLLLAPSIKAGLDIDWSDPKQKVVAVEIVERQVSSLQRWVDKNLDDEFVSAAILPYSDTVKQVRKQDLEESRTGATAIRQGVARDRRISVEDAEMRHGRKSRSKRFDGYKEHVARDLDRRLVICCAVTPANQPEENAAVPMGADIKRQKLRVTELHIDRAYVNSPFVDDVIAAGGTVLAKPWAQRPHRPGLFSKLDFKIDLRTKTITCPAGELEFFQPGATVSFDPEACGACKLRSKCTESASGRGRTVSISENEARQKKFRRLQQTRTGRETLRQRTAVEHSLAHIAARKGPHARYWGTRKNLFDLRRAATIQNLEGLHQVLREAA